jgi:hypothetical protein
VLTTPRLLAQGSTVDVKVAHGVLEQRVKGAASEFGSAGADVPLSDLFTDFVNTTRFHLTECLRSPERCVRRLESRCAFLFRDVHSGSP